MIALHAFAYVQSKKMSVGATAKKLGQLLILGLIEQLRITVEYGVCKINKHTLVRETITNIYYIRKYFDIYRERYFHDNVAVFSKYPQN